MKCSRTTPRDSSKLRVEVLLKALLIEHKCGHTNNIKHVYEYEQVIIMQVRERRSNTNKRIRFEVRATALRPCLHTEGFQLSTIGSSTEGPPLRNYNLQPWSTQLQLSHLYTRGSTKQRRKSYSLDDSKITNNT